MHSRITLGSVGMLQKRIEPIDVLVGRNIRARRQANDLSQTALGKAIGVSFQQVQKYEKGANRVGASRLMQIANVLRVPITSLFEGTEITETVDNEPEQTFANLLGEPIAYRAARAFAAIRNRGLRRSLVDLMETIVAKDED